MHRLHTIQYSAARQILYIWMDLYYIYLDIEHLPINLLCLTIMFQNLPSSTKHLQSEVGFSHPGKICLCSCAGGSV